MHDLRSDLGCALVGKQVTRRRERHEACPRVHGTEEARLHRSPEIVVILTRQHDDRKVDHTDGGRDILPAALADPSLPGERRHPSNQGDGILFQVYCQWYGHVLRHVLARVDLR